MLIEKTIILGSTPSGRVAEGHLVQVSALRNVPEHQGQGPWIAGFCVDEEIDRIAFGTFVGQCIKNGACYLCCIGRWSKEAEEVVDDECDSIEETESKHLILTTSSVSIREGTWELMESCSHPVFEATQQEVHFFFFDGQTLLKQVQDTISIINAGWLPPDL